MHKTHTAKGGFWQEFVSKCKLSDCQSLPFRETGCLLNRFGKLLILKALGHIDFEQGLL